MHKTPLSGQAADRWDLMPTLLGIDLTPGTNAAETPRLAPVREDLFTPQPDGSRTRHLTHLAGVLLTRGLPPNQVESICQMWNEKNQPPLDRAKVSSACASIAKSDARNHPDRRRVIVDTAPIAPLFNIADARISRFLGAPPPPRRWVLENFLPLGIVGAVVAPGGSSKSQLLMQLAYSVATGVPLAGHWQVGEAGTVLMLCAEDADEEIHRRVHRMHNQQTLPTNAAARQQLVDRFLIRSVVGDDVLLTEAGSTNEVKQTEVLERLVLTAKQATNLKLIIIDPASRFRGGDENSNADATRFVQALELLSKETGATVLIAHHAHKGAYSGGEATQNASRGASALVDGIRWMLTLQPPKGQSKGVPASERRLVEAAVVKTNYTAMPAPVLLRREADGYLQAVLNMPDKGLDGEALRQLLALVLHAPGKLSARSIELDHTGENKAIALSQKKTRELVAFAVTNDLLETGAKHLLTLTQPGRDALGPNPPAKRQGPMRRVLPGIANRRRKGE